MSTNSYNSAADYLATAKPSLFTRIREYMRAVNSGLAAWREYERLRANGIEHQVAAARSFEKHFTN